MNQKKKQKDVQTHLKNNDNPWVGFHFCCYNPATHMKTNMNKIQHWTKEKTMERKTLGVRKIIWKKWWQQWWKWVGWQARLHSHTTTIKYELPQHENRAWWTPQTSTKDEHELYKKWA